LQKELILILDEIQNPGNLGTIIRIADWFGIKHIICSLNTADVYNSKTVQATMGALARVNVHYVDLITFLQSYSKLDLPIYGTFLNGDNLYTATLSRVGAVAKVMKDFLLLLPKTILLAT
jgi:TrmH family RNA methyltransferase